MNKYKFAIIGAAALLAAVLLSSSYSNGRSSVANEFAALPTQTAAVQTAVVTRMVTNIVVVTGTPSPTATFTRTPTRTPSPTMDVQGTVVAAGETQQAEFAETLIALTPTKAPTLTPTATPTVSVEGTVHAVETKMVVVFEVTLNALTPSATPTATATATLSLPEAQATGISMGQTQAAPTLTATLSGTEVIGTFVAENGMATATMTPSMTPTSTPSVPNGFVRTGFWTVGTNSAESIELFVRDGTEAGSGTFVLWTRETGPMTLVIDARYCSGTLTLGTTEIQFVPSLQSVCTTPMTGFWTELRLTDSYGNLYVLSQ